MRPAFGMLRSSGLPVPKNLKWQQAAFDAGCQCMPLKTVMMLEMPGSPSLLDNLVQPNQIHLALAGLVPAHAGYAVSP